jgi:AcrR family transcriptional regulator
MVAVRRQQDRSRVTRERLVEAAIECLVEVGYAGTSTNAVCERAGLSRGAQLHHFPSKHELLVGAVEHLLLSQIAQIQGDVDAVRNAEDPVRAVVERIWAAFRGSLFYAAAELWMAARTDPALHAVVYSVERRLGHEIHGAFHDIFPARVGGSPGFDEALDTAIYLMRGLAMTRILREDPVEEERVLNLCTSLLKREHSATTVG